MSLGIWPQDKRRGQGGVDSRIVCVPSAAKLKMAVAMANANLVKLVQEQAEAKD